MSAKKYSGRPNPKLIGVCFVLFCLLLSIVLHPQIPGAVRAEVGKPKKVNGTSRAQNQAGGCCGGDEGNNTAHVLAGTYYTINDTFSAKLLLNNKGPTAIQAQVTLFSLNGERFDAPSITVEANAHRFEDFAHWVAMAGEQFREGSIQVFHRGKDLVLGTQIYLTDVKHSLSFEEKLTELGKPGSSRFEAVWWLPTPKGVVNLVLSNTTDTVLSVSATVLGKSPKREAGTTVDIAPHATRVLDIQRDGSEENRLPCLDLAPSPLTITVDQAQCWRERWHLMLQLVTRCRFSLWIR